MEEGEGGEGKWRGEREEEVERLSSYSNHRSVKMECYKTPSCKSRAESRRKKPLKLKTTVMTHVLCCKFICHILV